MKNNKMPDTSLIPAQQVNSILKMILNELSDLRTRDEQRGSIYKAVVEDYNRKDPVKVIPINEAPTLVRTECPESVLERIGRIESVLDPLVHEVRKVGDRFASQTSRLDELMPRKRVLIFKDSIASKVAFVISGLLVIICLLQMAYTSLWSDDAWAKRAYKAAVQLGYQEPGLYYDDVRKSFRDGYKKTAKGNVCDIELKARHENRRNDEEVQL